MKCDSDSRPILSVMNVTVLVSFRKARTATQSNHVFSCAIRSSGLSLWSPDMNVELKNVRIHPDMSEETECFSATIYLDGRKVGTVKNHGHGGCHEYYWTDYEAGRRLDEWAKAQPTEFEFEKLDQIFDSLLSKNEILSQLKRWVKNETLFRLKGDTRRKWRTFGAVYNAKVVAFLTKQYGDELELILNPADLDAALPYCS
jgi:hypothetical protein